MASSLLVAASVTVFPVLPLLLQAWRRGTRFLGLLLIIFVIMGIIYFAKKIVAK